MKRLKAIAILFSLGLFAFLLSRLQLQTSWERLRHLNLGYFFLAFLVGAPEFLFKSLRLRSFVGKAKSHLSVKNAVLTFFSGQPLASVTPGKLGDVSRIVLLNRFGKISMPTALAVHAADRIYDLASIILLAVVGLVSYMSEIAKGSQALGTLIGMLCGMLLILALINPKWMKYILKPLVTGLLSRKLADQLSHHGREFNEKLHLLLTPSFKIFGPFVLSFLAWETAFLRNYFMVLALGLGIPYLKLVLLIPVMVVVELLPISILGFGPREAALFMLFTTSSVHQEDLAVFSILMAIGGPIFAALLGIPATSHFIPKDPGHAPS